jgi:hypothetical protein
MIARGDRRIVAVDADGVAHFNPDFRNAALLSAALQPLGLDPGETARILAVYEQVFDHQSFTGRSGTFYKYEGLGCIYWHMVSKLLLETQGAIERALRAGEDETVPARLRAHYRAIRDGIGAHKTPASYGAIPTDPYSHTPGFAGAQQPGMTGQVKEDILSRFGEMGVVVESGRLSFDPRLAERGEFLTAPQRFRYFALDGRELAADLEAGTLAFTFCQTPVVVHGEAPDRIVLTLASGEQRVVCGLTLNGADSASIFARKGEIVRLDLCPPPHPPPALP